MKKNIVGHMAAPKSSKKTIWKRLDLIPRILCLLLALVIWLLVFNAKNENVPEAAPQEQSALQETLL